MKHTQREPRRQVPEYVPDGDHRDGGPWWLDQRVRWLLSTPVPLLGLIGVALMLASPWLPGWPNTVIVGVAAIIVALVHYLADISDPDTPMRRSRGMPARVLHRRLVRHRQASYSSGTSTQMRVSDSAVGKR